MNANVRKWGDGAVFPSQTLVRAVRDAGHAMQLLWQVPGQPNTRVAWICCYEVGRSLVIVETFVDEQWNAFTPPVIDDRVSDVFNRCGIRA
jgi:hypothetical protein